MAADEHRRAGGTGEVDFDAWYAQAKGRPSIDRDADELSGKYAREQDNIIIDGRIAFHMARGSPYRLFNVFVTVSPDEGARRMLNDDREKARYGTFENARNAWLSRIRDERERYRSLYGIDHHDLANYHHVVDSTGLTREQVVEDIIAHLPRP
jgi:cytidylate kinase